MIMKFVPFLFNDGKEEALNGNCVFFAKEREREEVWKIGGVLKSRRIAINHRLFCRGRLNALSRTLKCRYDVEFCAKYREKEDITTLNCSATRLEASIIAHNRIIKRRIQ